MVPGAGGTTSAAAPHTGQRTCGRVTPGASASTICQRCPWGQQKRLDMGAAPGRRGGRRAHSPPHRSADREATVLEFPLCWRGVGGGSGEGPGPMPRFLQTAFKQFYEGTEKGEQVEPARRYDIRAKLDASGIYLGVEVERCCAVSFKPKARQSSA